MRSQGCLPLGDNPTEWPWPAGPMSCWDKMEFYFASFLLCTSITRLTFLMDRASTKSGRCQLVSLDFWHNIQTCDVTCESQEAKLWWPHQAKEPTLSTLLKVICSSWTLWFGLFINLFSFSPSKWKTDKCPGQITPEDLLLPQVILGDQQPISLSGGICHSSGEQLMREAEIRQLPELQFCLHMPWRRARKWLLLHGLIIFLLEEEKKQAFVLLLLDVLLIFDKILISDKPWREWMGKLFGRLCFISEKSQKEGRGKEFCFSLLHTSCCSLHMGGHVGRQVSETRNN